MGPVNFNGKWMMDTVEDWEEWLGAVGLDEAKRKAVSIGRPTEEITEDGKSFLIKVHMANGKMHESRFTVGVEGTNVLPFGLKLIGKAEWEGNKLVHRSVAADDKAMHLTHIRELIDGNMVMTAIISGSKDVTAKRVYKKV